MDENPYQAPLEDGDSPGIAPGPKRPLTVLEWFVVATIIVELTALVLPFLESAD